MTDSPTPRHTDHGFTLIELLIAIAVMGVVIPALASAFYVSAKTIDGTTDRVAGSSALSLAATKFGPDVQSAVSVLNAPSPLCPLAEGQTALLTTIDKDGSIATWYSTPEALGRRACTSSATSTWTVPVHPGSAVTVECEPVTCSSTFFDIALRFTPLEGNPVALSSARRNS